MKEKKKRSLTRARWLSRVPLVILLTAITALATVAIVGIARTDPPPPIQPVPDVAAKQAVGSIAVMCARLYMTWDSRKPDEHASGLAPCVGEGELDSGLGFEVPGSGFQDVFWAAAVQTQEVTDKDSLVTVAVKTQRGITYVVMPIRRYRGEGVGLFGYPAFVGAPRIVAAKEDAGDSVDDTALEAVLRRVLENYLAKDRRNLASDLSPDAVVALPIDRYTLENVEQVNWIETGKFVAVGITAAGKGGERYRLRYEIKVVRSADRWFVERIETDPKQMKGVPL